MSDYIKREDAIRVCNERQIISGDFITGIRYPTADEIREVITDIPSADVVDKELYDRAVSRVTELSIELSVEKQEYDALQNVRMEQLAELAKGMETTHILKGLERKRGEWRWVDTVSSVKECSVCGKHFINTTLIKGGECTAIPCDTSWNYCPNCGADMRGNA